MFKGKRYLQLQQLLDEANERLKQFPDLDQAPFTKRTVYYYVQEGLLQRPEGIRRGPRTPYPVDFVDRLIFIRRLQSEEALTLEHIQQVLSDTPADTIQRVADGSEDIQTVFMAPDQLPAAVASSPPPEVDKQVGKLQKSARTKLRKKPIDDGVVADMAMDDGVVADMALDMMAKEEGAPDDDLERAEQQTEIYRAGNQATLEVQGELSERQRKQLEKATELIKSIIEDNEDDDKR